MLSFNVLIRLFQDLIVFPSDATFVPVTQAPGGRVHVLKFSSSDQRHFFWFQDQKPEFHARHAQHISLVLDDPQSELPIPITGSQPSASTSTAPAASTSAAPSGSNPAFNADQLSQLRALVSGLPQTQGAGASSGAPDLSLSDVLTPANLAPLFNTASPEVLRSIFPTLPADLPVPPSPEVLRRLVESSQFQAQVRALDRALQTGLVGNLVVGLGLPEEAGLGIVPFLNAIEAQAKKARESQNDSMETD